MVEGKTFHKEYYPNPCEILQQEDIDFVIPMSLNWALEDWTEEFLRLQIPILCPIGEGFQIERERDFSQRLCQRYGVPFAKSFVARNKFEAEQILADHPSPYVIKNTFCSPTSPIHTIVSETLDQTRAWLEHIDYKEGVFLQQYLGSQEGGHIAFVSHGEIYSLISNQEYKRAFDGNQGIVAGAPLGGLVEQDPHDTYHLARELLHPLLPWFREVGFHGPIQVTAIKYENTWYVIEFNIRLGVTCGPLILRMLKNPIQVLAQVVNNQPLESHFHEERQFGCSLTLAGYGYPYTQLVPPRLSVEVSEPFDCDVWWNEVDKDRKGRITTSGQGANRIADVTATGRTVEEAIETAYRNIKKITCPGSYYRTDIGQSLWPLTYDK
jgi:phosphoribosylamine-glycine ligase